MTAAFLSAGLNMSSDEDNRPKLQSCVSIVVDEVDDDLNPSSPCDLQSELKDNSDEVFDHSAESPCEQLHHRSKESRGSTSREESETRLQQIKDEVRHRRDEFARLLDEHEQVVRELRRIESSGELQNLVDVDSSGTADIPKEE